MKRSFAKPGLGLATVCAMFGVGVPAVLAATDSDTGLSPKTSKIALAPQTKLTVSVPSDVAGVLKGHSLTCTASTANLTIPSTGFNVKASRPKFSGCTDNIKSGDTDTLKATGTWSATYKDASDASGEVKGAGDKIVLKVPKNGVTALSTVAKSCAIFFNPKGQDRPMVGAYNDKTGHLTLSKKSLTFVVNNAPKQSGTCPVKGDTGKAQLSATYVANPVVADN